MYFFRHHTPIIHPFFMAPDPAQYVVPTLGSDKPSNGSAEEPTDLQPRDKTVQPAKSNSVDSCSSNVQVTEQDNGWTIYMDIPGVKSGDVTIEEKEGVLNIAAHRKNGIRYQQHFLLDAKTTDVSNAHANLSDGVLAISVPKKGRPASVKIPLAAEDAPEDNENDFTFSLDLPGVKIDNLDIELKDDKLLIHAQRKRLGNSDAKIKRVVQFESSVNMAQAKAYLSDGVLNLVAPKVSGRTGDAMQTRRVPLIGAKPMVETVPEDA